MSREHFSVGENKKEFYFMCPLQQDCGAFREEDGHLICEYCGEYIEDEAIKKGVVYDNRKK